MIVKMEDLRYEKNRRRMREQISESNKSKTPGEPETSRGKRGMPFAICVNCFFALKVY